MFDRRTWWDLPVVILTYSWSASLFCCSFGRWMKEEKAVIGRMNYYPGWGSSFYGTTMSNVIEEYSSMVQRTVCRSRQVSYVGGRTYIICTGAFVLWGHYVLPVRACMASGIRQVTLCDTFLWRPSLLHSLNEASTINQAWIEWIQQYLVLIPGMIGSQMRQIYLSDPNKSTSSNKFD